MRVRRKNVVRIVKEPHVRRGEILDVAQKLFYLKGYEQTSVQDIITEIGIAKGTFYHYFSSKLDLLDVMIERMIDQTLQSLEPMVADDQLFALEKFKKFFTDITDWKTENEAFFLDIMSIWYKDENAILRQKVRAASVKSTMPLLTQIIEQGIAEGVFATEHPADIAEIVLHIGDLLSDTLAKIILASDQSDDSLEMIERKIMVYQYAIERTLNAPTDSIKLFDLDQVKPWLGGVRQEGKNPER
jgi:TetR/AcrR family transcriptional repressor of nem operon